MSLTLVLSRQARIETRRLLEVNPEGTVPVLKDQETGTWIPDSGAIVDYIEDLYPKPATGHVADSKDAYVVGGVGPC